MVRTPFFHRRQHKRKAEPVLFHGNRGIDDESRLKGHASLFNMTADGATLDDWLTLCLRVFIGTELTGIPIDHEFVNQVLNKALGSLWYIGERTKRKQRMEATVDELIAIQEAINLVEDLQNLSTPHDYRNAYKHSSSKVTGWTNTMASLHRYKEYAI